MNSSGELAAIEQDVHKMRAGVLYLFAKLEVKDRYLADIVNSVWSGVSTFVPGSRAIMTTLESAGLNASAAFEVEEGALGAVRSAASYVENAAHEFKFRSGVRRGLIAIWAQFRSLITKAYAAVKGIGPLLIAKVQKLLDTPPWELVEKIGEAIVKYLWPAVYSPAVTVEAIVDGVINFFLKGAELIRNQFAVGMSAFQQGYQRNVVRGITFASTMMRIYDAVAVGRNVGMMAKLHFPFALIGNVLRLFMRFFEAHVLKDVVAEARENFRWGGYEVDGKFSFRNETSASIAKHGKDFDEWFGPYAVLVPSVACLTMSCQVFGNEMYYLDLLDDGDRAVSQMYKGVEYSRYDLKRNRAMNYTAEFLKEEANRYLKQCGITFIHPDIRIEQRDVLTGHGEFHVRPLVRSVAGTLLGGFGELARHIPKASVPHLVGM